MATCDDGDVFFTREAPRGEVAFGTTTWTVPKDAREVPSRPTRPGSSAAGSSPRRPPSGARAAEPVRVRLRAHRPGRPDAQERVRNAAAALDPRIDVVELRRTRTDAQFAQLRRAMLIGASIVIGLIGLSLLLTALEQLRERRRLLAVLVAFGTRRSTLSWSVLWQSALPVGLGLAIAVLTGIAPRLRAAADPRQSGARRLGRRRGDGGRRHGRRAGVTAASLPVLWRTMRPEGLRTE